MKGKKCYRVGKHRVSLDGRAVWPVIESQGMCGCGEVEMTSTIAYFSEKADAETFLKAKRAAADEKPNC